MEMPSWSKRSQGGGRGICTSFYFINFSLASVFKERDMFFSLGAKGNRVKMTAQCVDAGKPPESVFSTPEIKRERKTVKLYFECVQGGLQLRYGFLKLNKECSTILYASRLL